LSSFPRPRAAVRRATLALAFTALPFTALSACQTDDTTTTDTFAVTSVSVDPDQFLSGGIHCGADGMQVYVATLFDVTEGSPELALPSSAPVPCLNEVRFERVVIGREYAADVQGYDRADIVPLGCYPDEAEGCAGSPVMVDRATGAYVAPRWKTSCGRHRVRPTATSTDGGLIATDGGGTPADAAAPLVDAAAPEPPPLVAADAGALYYYDCRGKVLNPDETPWLEGPVCVQDLITSKLRGCDPLTTP
jgi:hypothetical protein